MGVRGHGYADHPACPAVRHHMGGAPDFLSNGDGDYTVNVISSYRGIRFSRQKLENDAAASLCAVAAKRERNVKLAEEAVLKSGSFTDKETLTTN